MASLLTSELRKARKEHQCNFCLGVINKGDTYLYDTLKDADFYTWKTCEHCLDVLNKFDIYANNDELTQGDFEEIITDLCIDNGIAWQDMSLQEMVIALKEKEV
jgi:tRNA U54 and U55 pseudouridine synthase Pus10